MTAATYEDGARQRRFWAAVVVFVGIAAVLVLVALFIGERTLMFNARTIKLQDVRIGTTAVLTKRRAQADGLAVLITGELDGKALISLSYADGVEYRYETEPGRIRLKDVKQWPAERAVFRYQPLDVQSGELTIRYRFVNMNN